MTIALGSRQRVFKDTTGPATLTIVEGAAPSSSTMVVRGIFQRANTKNANGRIYGDKLWERVLGDESLNERLRRRQMLGMVEHPRDGSTNLAHVSHVVTNLSRRGNDIIGEAEILNTPSGKIIQELLRSNIPVGISSRGRGTSELRGGVEYVNEDTFQLDTFDFVYKPSTPGAYPELQEAALGKPYRKDSTMKEKIDEVKRLEVEAMKLAEGQFDSLSAAQKAFTTAVELDESLMAIVEGLDEASRIEHAALLESAADRTAEARAATTAAVDAVTDSSSDDTDRRVENARAGLVPKKKGKDTSKEEDEDTDADPLVEELQSLVSEIQEQRDHYREQATELRAALAEDDNGLRKRLAAAIALSEELASRLDEATSVLNEREQELEALSERYEAAQLALTSVAERASKGKLFRKIREAVEETPALAKVIDQLKRCDSETNLDEAVRSFRELAGLPTQAVEESLLDGVSLSAARDDGDADDGEEFEPDTAEIGDRANGRLVESIGPTPAAARMDALTSRALRLSGGH